MGVAAGRFLGPVIGREGVVLVQETLEIGDELVARPFQPTIRMSGSTAMASARYGR